MDWGTSSFRAWLLSDTGAVLDAVRAEEGTLAVSGRAARSDDAGRAREFASVLQGLAGRWLAAAPGIPVLAAGMVGSNQGWCEAPYLDLPADLARLPDALVEVAAGRSTVHIVPGLRSSGAVPDVIRGEEVQIVGALGSLDGGARHRTLVLPGTHSKWVEVVGASIVHFSTSMTGELYGLVMKDSIVSRLAAPPVTTDAVSGVDPGVESGVPAGAGDDRAEQRGAGVASASRVTLGHAATPPAFERGLAAMAGDVGRNGLAAALFTGRTLVMSGQLLPSDVGDYVSGLLVGDEVAHFVTTVPHTDTLVTVCGTPRLGARYAAALAFHGVAAVTITESVSARGLWAIARAAGLVADVAHTPLSLTITGKE